jgi:hypothetical protein
MFGIEVVFDILFNPSYGGVASRLNLPDGAEGIDVHRGASKLHVVDHATDLSDHR